MTAPSQRALDKALEFARGQSDWIARQLSRVPAPVMLGVGAQAAVQGRDHVVREGESRARRGLGGRRHDLCHRRRRRIIRAA